MRLSTTLLLAALLLCACGGNIGDDITPTGGGGVGRVGHVFIIVLENENADVSFGASSPAPYLSRTLVASGAFLPNYYGTGHLSLDNYVSMVSGQAPNPLTQSDCQIYLDWIGTGVVITDGQVQGTGCVYPASAKTIADQIDAAGLTWRGYMEDMGNDVARDGSATCAHPTPNSQDGTQSADANDNYAARHDPFMYFHSIIDDQARCDAHVVPLTMLDADLAANTPNYVFITPSLCHDGHDAPCANGTEPGGLESADAFLQEWVPRILASPAYQRDGLLIVTFDEAEISPTDPLNSDATACCGESVSPNSPVPPPGIYGLGGGRVGAVLMSPFIRPGTVTQTPYNHYSMLKSVEDILGLPYLGYAGASGLVGFGPDVFTNP
jgi:hypothetical protein